MIEIFHPYFPPRNQRIVLRPEPVEVEPGIVRLYHEPMAKEDNARVRLFADAKGPYGIGLAQDNGLVDHNEFMIIRPDRLRDFDRFGSGNAALQQIPTMAQSPFANLLEGQLVRSKEMEIRKDRGVTDPMLLRRFDIYGDFLPSPSTETWKKVFTIRTISYRIINAWMRQVLPYADQDALKIARRFKPGQYRSLIYEYCAKDGIRATQLANVFPILAYFIALFTEWYDGHFEGYDRYRYAAFEARKMVLAGKRLKDVAACMGIPMALQKLLPITATEFGADTLQWLNSDHDQEAAQVANFTRLIDAYLPKKVKDQLAWVILMDKVRRLPEGQEFYARNAVEMFRQGEKVAREYTARDLAREKALHPRKKKFIRGKDVPCQSSFGYMYVENDKLLDYLRASLDDEHLYHEVAAMHPFNARMGVPAALEAAQDYHVRLNEYQQAQRAQRAAALQLDDGQGGQWHDYFARQREVDRKRAVELAKLPWPEQWLPDIEEGGYKIIYLKSPMELINEGEVMGHCVGGYSQEVIDGHCQIYTIHDRKDHKLATLELRKGQNYGRNFELRSLHIGQLYGPCNRDVDPKISEAARTWVQTDGKTLDLKIWKVKKESELAVV